MVTVKNIKTYSGVKEIRIRIDRQSLEIRSLLVAR